MDHQEKHAFTILLVDDHEENLISLQAILKAPGRQFLKARSGNEALKLVLKYEDIGLIMLDVQMPDMDGFEVASVLKSNIRTKEISIIFVTAINKELQYVLKGYEGGAVDYLQKPLDMKLIQSRVKVFQDLYEQRQELKKTIELKAVINDQLERFMFMVAHDLKSPLAGVVGLLQLMKDDERITSQEDLNEYTGLMLNASNNLIDMIGSILAYSRQNSKNQVVEEIDVHVMLREMSRLLFPPSHIKIILATRLPVIVTNKPKLQQVFQNLLSNSIKYMDKENGEISIGHEDDGDFVKFYVKDNGSGIPEENRKRIFNLFETGDQASARDSSTGIGLNIMKMHVAEQGGKITVESTPGEGSTFYFQWLKKMMI
ncbi:sensor histidine kinase [Pedobacter sp. PWIIR3]